MLVRLLVAAALLGVALVVAQLLGRRRRDAPTRDRHPVPHQLDRQDFPRPEAAWLVALFSSRTCDSCQTLPAKLAPLVGAEVSVVEVAYQERRDLHDRYEIAAVPTTVVADAQGVVQRSFVGAFTATDLWAALAELREPGSSPEPRLGAGS
jgi:hypothetical protein